MTDRVIVTVTTACAPERRDTVIYEKGGVIATAAGDISKGVPIPAGSRYLGFRLQPPVTGTISVG